MNNAGIDYGMGKTNIDKETRIRYGVIPVYDILQAWAESSECIFACQECEEKEKPEEERNCDCCEAVDYVFNEEGYEAIQNADDIDVFITKSPYFTYCKFCSPCAPGAGYLRDHIKDGVKTYCFGHDFFEDGKAPYPVYSVETGELVEP